ncbi:LysR family transcriptional regulator [Thiomicrorhabdus sp. 6S2-11]|uniref:LysR family transcriptional regulator n=1 Tax=Thiomicrorhabdus marina TaxID=2818442 RepID=A0ABS3Q271_9GAMM|nr:LysR family transcriptional regulator [Thiomicrorhabdus marina]MBO1926427.1 LysR family transcriptional regulator [Thiomicrorhabdus marina]
MKLEYFHYFIEIAQAGSIAKAAAKLNRNRTTISMAIASLEDNLNAELFIRSGNSMHLSPIGEKILDDSIRLVTLTENIKRTVETCDSDQPAVLRLGRDDVLPESFWRRILRAIRLQYPGLTLAMNYANAGTLLEQLRQGEIDLACCMPEHFEQNKFGLYAQVVDKIAMRLMVSAEHPLSNMRSVSDEDLKSVPQITYLGNDQNEVFSLEQVSQEQIALSSFELVRDAISDGLGWGFVPDPLLVQMDQNHLLPVAHGLNISWHTYLIFGRESLNHESTFIGSISGLIRREILELFERKR